MDLETEYEPIQIPPSKQNEPHSTIEINDPTSEFIRQNGLSHSKSSVSNLRPNPNPNYSEEYSL